MKTKKTSVNRETWQTTRSERLNYYIGDLGRQGVIAFIPKKRGLLKIQRSSFL